jgi:DNA-binding NarL/FixJ family response regulator
MHSDKRFVAEMLKAGAVGYILKDCAFDELERAVRAAQYNQIYLSPSISGVLVQDYMRGSAPADASPASKLSEREREVLQLLAEGKVSREIAEHLNLSVKTVETHRKHIMDKLEIYTVSELTKFAIREGLTSLDR